MELGMLIIAILLCYRHVSRHYTYRTLYKKAERVNQEHLDYLMRGGK